MVILKLKILMKPSYMRKLPVLIWIGAFWLLTFSSVFNVLTLETPLDHEVSISPHEVHKLMSLAPSSFRNNTLQDISSKTSSFQYSKISYNESLSKNQGIINSNETSFYNPLFKITEQNDVVIDKINPEAMEADATNMEFLLNFTIIDAGGITDPFAALQNITISNSSYVFNVTNWFDWKFSISQPEKYSLAFILDSLDLSAFTLGFYNLTINTFVMGVKYSSDSVSFPMKDLQIDIIRVVKSEFNNKLDSDQLFNITMQVQEDDGSVTHQVETLSGNPNTTLHSTLQPSVFGGLYFRRFVKFGNETPIGEFIFEVNLTATVAKNPAFDDAIHTLVVLATSITGISDNGTIDFEARGTILLVKIDEISVGSNPPLDFNEITNEGRNHVEFRINVNDSINVKFQVFDNTSEVPIPSEEARRVIYQDPNNPGDRTALNSTETGDYGNGSVSLTARVYTSVSEGYSLLFYVSGHKSSQEEEPTNITIFWDLLEYKFIYYDNRVSIDGIGSSKEPNEKALGIDVGEWWTLNLSVYYVSDHSPAKSSQISYRFSGDSWTSRTDGTNGDLLDGSFTFNHINFSVDTTKFECQVENGSIFDPQGTVFVNRTVGDASFSLDLTWTYLNIEMIPAEADKRLSTNEITEISFFVSWAHDSSPFSGTLIAKDISTNLRKTVIITNGAGTWSSLVKTGPENYTFMVLSVNDGKYGITKFTDPTEDQPDLRDVKVAIVWDNIYFTLSDTYDFSKNVSEQNWGVNFTFANFGENQTIYCYGRHSYDNKPFIGTAVLVDWDSGDMHTVVFNGQGVGNKSLDRTDARDKEGVPFEILYVDSEPEYNITRLSQTRGSNLVYIVWDKVLITLEADMSYSHGTWADISVSLEYEVSTDLTIDSRDVEYSLLMSNGTFYENISWTHFTDYSFGPTVHWYYVTNLIDYKTGLAGYDVLYKWPDKSRTYGNLTVFWIDDEDPTILEFRSYDLGNGTILIIVDATDDDESWEGSGIGEVTLIDNREGVEEEFPINGTSYLLSEEYGIYRYIFSYSFNQFISEGGWGDYFQFEFGETLYFSVNVADQGTPSFHTEDFDPPPKRIVTSEVLTITADLDLHNPQFIKRNGTVLNLFYHTMENTDDLTNISDGDVIITTYVQDSNWSGLNENSVQLNISNIDTSESNIFYMTLNGALEARSPLEFSWSGNLPVGNVYVFTVTVTDNAGNSNIYSKEWEIEDRVAPRILNIILTPTGDRKINATVELKETGLGIDYVTIGLTSRGQTRWFNLTSEGGTGSSLHQSDAGVVTYSTILSLDFDILDILTPKPYSIEEVIVADMMGNSKEYSSDELENINIPDIIIYVQLGPLIFEPIILAFGLIMLVTGIVIGIRITSKVEGYDMKRIFTESERISREEILTLMDEYALGVTVNFFDQIQGPVPVIWEPPLLEDQEQVMLDLSDKSFSTLEFIGIEETERSGTFDFSTGSYECTALGYSFSIANPEARGGKENLTIVLLLRKEWGDHLLVFQDELLEKVRELRKMIESQEASSKIESSARQLREFVSKLMITFSKIYIEKEKKESKSKVE